MANYTSDTDVSAPAGESDPNCCLDASDALSDTELDCHLRRLQVAVDTRQTPATLGPPTQGEAGDSFKAADDPMTDWKWGQLPDVTPTQETKALQTEAETATTKKQVVGG